MRLLRPGKGGKLKGASKPIRLKPGDKTASEMVLEEPDLFRI